MAFGWLYGQPPSVTDRLCELEEEAELEFCRPRESGVALFRAALSAGRRVIVITDSCLESASLEKLLQKCGIKGYEAVYSSADCRRLKRTGTLFTWVRRHRPGTKILHIGDNRETDVEMAKRMGLAAVHISGARENLTGPFCGRTRSEDPRIGHFLRFRFASCLLYRRNPCDQFRGDYREHGLFLPGQSLLCRRSGLRPAGAVCSASASFGLPEGEL